MLEELEEKYRICLEANDTLQEENEELKNQLNYLRSGEYLNQLRFERNILQDIVKNMEVSKEDKEFIDCTHRNTELLEQQQEFIKYLKDEKFLYEINTQGYSMNLIENVLAKYKGIIGVNKDE